MCKITLSEKFVIAMIIAFNLWICNVRAQLGNCAATEGDITLLYRDVVPGKLLENPIEIEMIRTAGVASHTEANSVKYFEVTFDGELNAVLINTADNFVEYEKEQSAVERLLTVTLNCANSQTVVMFLTMQFQEVNNFSPEFTKTDYEFEIPLPLPVGFDIFSFITDKISATDYDLHFNQITFTSDMTHPFKVETSSVTGTMGKEFFATITTTEKISNIKNGFEFQITASDSFIGDTKSATANVKITAQFDEDFFIQVPIFSKSLYTGVLDFQQTQPLELETTISLLEETNAPSIEFDLELSDFAYFDITSTTDSIKITLKDTVMEDDFNGITQLSFVVTATRIDGIRGHAAVLINVLPKRSLTFEKSLYTGTIKSDLTIEPDPIVLQLSMVNIVDIEFELSDYTDLFEITKITDGAQITKKKLATTDVEGKSTFQLTVTARSENAITGSTTLILAVGPFVLPVFEKQTYTGRLKRPISSESLEIEDIVIVPYQGTIEFELSGEDTDIIKISSNVVNGVSLGLVDDIEIGDIADRTVLSAIVTAKLTNTIIQSTVVLIHVESEDLSCQSTDSECDEIGLIVVIITLALLFLLSLIAIFVMWWKWIRPYRYIKRDSSNEELENDFNDVSYTEPVAPIAIKHDADIIAESNFDVRNDNPATQITSSPVPHSSPTALAKSLESILVMDNPPPNLVLDKDNLNGVSESDDNPIEPPKRKKSIKFNEMVERIDILDDTTDKDDTAL